MVLGMDSDFTSTSTATSASVAVSTLFSSSVPSNLPSTIKPEQSPLPVPTNSVLIQIGFNYLLNYAQVVEKQGAASSIFNDLPQGIAYGVKIPVELVVIQYLQPYEIQSTPSYNATLAMAYIPQEQVNPLSQALLNPLSDLYNNPNSTVDDLMGNIDSSIPLQEGTSNPSITSVTPSSTSSPTGIATPKAKLAGWVIAVIVIGAILFFLCVGFLIWFRRRKLAKGRTTTPETNESDKTDETDNTDKTETVRSPCSDRPMTRSDCYTDGTEKTDETGTNLSRNLSPGSVQNDSVCTDRIVPQVELMTSANRHELEDTSKKIARSELEGTHVQTNRSELNLTDAHTEGSDLVAKQHATGTENVEDVKNGPS